MLGTDLETKFGVDRSRRGGAKAGQAKARAVAGLVGLDGPDTRLLGGGSGRERAVADLHLNDVFPLPF